MHVRIEVAVVGSGGSSSDDLHDWSESRPWISKHHLVRTPFASHTEDFGRMCRRISGRSIGLVLGSGGARGLAHLGAINALLEEVGVTYLLYI